MKSTFLNNEVPGQEIFLAEDVSCTSHTASAAYTPWQGCVKARTIKLLMYNIILDQPIHIHRSRPRRWIYVTTTESTP